MRHLTRTALAALLATTAATSALAAAPAPATRPTAAASDRIVLPRTVEPSRYEIAVTPDMKAMTFTGHVDITVEVKAPTRTIELNAAELTFSRVALAGAGAPQVAMDAERQTATLTFSAPVAAGAHRLSIDYAGKINEHASGLFGLTYDTKAGPRTALFTQFENSDARRFVPSWDEPNRKAVFQLTVTVPRDLMPVSNMPVAGVQDAGGGLKRVAFRDSPRMSSYLLFFGLGDFERIHQDVDGVDVGVIFKRGDAEQAKYALDAEAHILRYYNDYFGVKFPLPKLDMIAGPGQSQFFGAMENWGAIFYFERDLLIDPKTSTEGDKQNVYIVVAHETAHQWFGDLVTMDWWDDLWLNEGFASWMEDKATNAFHPEWKLPLQAVGSKEGAMRLDAKSGTHPVINHIRDVLQANQAFDGITYQKGEAVIAMLESYVGAATWRAGVRNYIRKHAYGNTTTDDLWREVDAVSPRKLTDIAHDFTRQPGVPLVTVGEGGGGLTLTQGRFGVDAASKAAQRWRVPVAVRPLGGGAAPASETVVDGSARLPGGPAVVNAGQSGYFRTAYSPALFARVLAAYPTLPAIDQIGIAGDAWALGQAGYAPVSQFLDLTVRTPAEADPLVWSRIVGTLTGIDGLYDGQPGQAAFRAYARRVVQPLYARLGWDKKPGEADNVALLRATTIAALSEFDDPAVIAEARRRFADYLARPDSLSPATRRSVLRTVARHADAATWEQLHGLARSAPSALTKDEYYTLLSAAADPALQRRALELAVSGEPPKTQVPTMIGVVSNYNPDLAFDFYAAHLDQVNAVLEPDSRNQFGPRLASTARGEAMIAKLRAFADAHIPAGARGDVTKAEAQIRFTVESRRKTGEISAWLAQQHG